MKSEEFRSKSHFEGVEGNVFLPLSYFPLVLFLIIVIYMGKLWGCDGLKDQLTWKADLAWVWRLGD